MDIKRIVGPDMRTALRMVREQMGPDAIILSNRRTAAGVEIIAGPEPAQGTGEPERTPAPASSAAAGLRARVAWAPLRAAAPGRVAPVEESGHIGAVQRAAFPALELRDAGEIRGLQDELRGLRDLLEQRLGEMHLDRLSWGPGNEGRAWRRLSRIGLPNELVRVLVDEVDARADWEQAWMAVRARLATGIAEAGDVVAGGGAFALVGPTGAGKTTTICKLAVRYVLEHGPDGLVLASFDATRIGGPDMLRALARLLEVPFHAAREGECSEELVARVGACRLLLIDTAGLSRRSGTRAEPCAELGRIAREVRSLLVLPCNAQQAWLARTVEEYRAAAPVAAVVTRLDETLSLGEVIGTLHGARLPLAYLSDGQEIPDDLHVAQAAALVAQALALDPEAEEPGAAPFPRVRRQVVAPDNAARIA